VRHACSKGTNYLGHGTGIQNKLEYLANQDNHHNKKPTNCENVSATEPITTPECKPHHLVFLNFFHAGNKEIWETVSVWEI